LNAYQGQSQLSNDYAYTTDTYCSAAAAAAAAAAVYSQFDAHVNQYYQNYNISTSNSASTNAAKYQHRYNPYATRSTSTMSTGSTSIANDNSTVAAAALLSSLNSTSNTALYYNPYYGYNVHNSSVSSNVPSTMSSPIANPNYSFKVE
jgi:hypothetical protein